MGPVQPWIARAVVPDGGGRQGFGGEIGAGGGGAAAAAAAILPSPGLGREDTFLPQQHLLCEHIRYVRHSRVQPLANQELGPLFSFFFFFFKEKFWVL